MNNFTEKKLRLLRAELEKSGLEACIIPTSDPHQSEYTASFWKFREYISGFTGSAGTLVVGKAQAGLWTDSRYYLQAEDELKGSDILLFKAGLPETPDPEQWILEQGYKSVGIDGSVFSQKEVHVLLDVFKSKGTTLDTSFEPYGAIWTDRPGFPTGKMYPFPERFSGESTFDKIRRLRARLESFGVDAMPISALDEIAWLFNLRGEDVKHSPVGICHAFVGAETSILFVDPVKLDSNTRAYLEKNEVSLLPYGELGVYLKSLKNRKILLDSSKISHHIYQSIGTDCCIVEGTSPVTEMKAIKNPVEISGFRKAMIRDGIALTRFCIWLEDTIRKSEHATYPDEWSIGEKIAEFRQEQENYVCESFSPIVGYNEHGAIVHYEATRDSADKVGPEGFLLIDTGGQYLDGTTDITRSWSLFAETPADYKEDYTRLLQGVIALSTAKFPAGTRGSQLDVLARQFLWQKGLNFGHGTGHGVGHFLNVHEGPQSIRMNENPVSLQIGMVTSNEPGLYRAGKYGIRLENLVLVCPDKTTDFGEFRTFETLTLFPFDLNCIEQSLLSPADKHWIDHYHQMVYEKLEPFLNKQECEWLQEKTRKI